MNTGVICTKVKIRFYLCPLSGTFSTKISAKDKKNLGKYSKVNGAPNIFNLPFRTEFTKLYYHSSLLAEFLIGKVLVKDRDSRNLMLVNANPVFFCNACKTPFCGACEHVIDLKYIYFLLIQIQAALFCTKIHLGLLV
jgi:hypothetical protein